MTLHIDTPTTDDLEAMVRLDARNFGAPVRDVDLERAHSLLDLDRFLVARDGGSIVALAGSYGLELTMPGDTRLAMCGVAWVSVSVTHRRQGITRRLMALLARQADERHESLLGLTASEGAIYERFGYGAATQRRSVVIDRRRAGIASGFKPDLTGVTLVEPHSSIDRFLAVYERYRRRQVGEIHRPRALFEWYLPDRSDSWLLAGALHDDGFAIWTVEQNWDEGDPGHHLRLLELIAVTPEAHLALWHTVLSIDLVGEIRTRTAVAPDDPLPFFLTNPRALKTEALADHLWLSVRDPVRAFAARRYRTNDRFVIDVGAGDDGETIETRHRPRRFSVAGDGDAVRVEPSDDRPDMVAAPSALGPLLLGGVSASALAAGRRLRGDKPVMERADAFFGSDPLPHCRSGF